MDAAVTAHRERIQAFSVRLLSDYTKHIDPSRTAHVGKEINDIVWQTIVLKPFELIILDSPILQRLRGLRQLGVAHWVYPAAGHSRFEHSLGALRQVQRLIDALNEHTRQRSDEEAGLIKPEWVHLLRLAALCHDIGHGLMSHVSENALKAHGTSEDLRLQFSDLFAGEEFSLSEIAAYFMLGSPAFEKLIKTAVDATAHDLPEKPCDLLQKLVLGQPVHSRFPLLHELISGPFDADKLDYMNRDACMAGVPIVTDIPRLVQKLRNVEVAYEELPPEIGRTVRERHPSYFVQAVMLSGARTIDELMLGRTLLYDKVYRHQKVRAVEAMVAVAISALTPFTQPEMLPLLLSDQDLLDFRRGTIEECLGVKLSAAQWDALKGVREIIDQLRARQLFVRAYAFSQSMPRDPFRGDPAQANAMAALQEDVEKPHKRSELLIAIVDEIKRMRTLVKDIAPTIPDEHLGFNIALDPPSGAGKHVEIARAFLVAGTNALSRFREDSAESAGWSNAYLLTRDIGYVFSAEPLAPAVYLACEYLLRRKYNIRTPASAADYAKRSDSSAEKLRRNLTDARYYQEQPDLRSEPERLSRQDIDGRIKAIVSKLSIFEGLARPGDEVNKPVRVDPMRVRLWLKQFPDEHVEAALAALDKIRVISRAEVHAAVDAFMATHPTFKGAYVCPFGEPKDSSAIVTYYVQDLKERYSFKICTLQDALANETAPILFVDDFVGSGSQSKTIVLNWLGLTKELPLDEDRGPPLTGALLEEFKKRKLGVLFVAGEQGGFQELCAELAKQRLDHAALLHIPDTEIPRAFDGRDKAMAFQSCCEKIGKALLHTGTGKTRSDGWVDTKKLGYGNNAFLIAFPYNVPSQALTLLWCGGQVDGWSWMPLMPRRTKV